MPSHACAPQAAIAAAEQATHSMQTLKEYLRKGKGEEALAGRVSLRVWAIMAAEQATHSMQTLKEYLRKGKGEEALAGRVSLRVWAIKAAE